MPASKRALTPAEFGVGARLARLHEGGQADAEDVGGRAGVGGHGVVWCGEVVFLVGLFAVSSVELGSGEEANLMIGQGLEAGEFRGQTKCANSDSG